MPAQEEEGGHDHPSELASTPEKPSPSPVTDSKPAAAPWQRELMEKKKVHVSLLVSVCKDA